MASIRVLGTRGMELFANYVAEIRFDPTKPPPIDRLARQPWSSEFTPHIEVGDPSATTRMELGEYLVNLFQANSVDRKDILNNVGMWSWLSLIWFDRICPTAPDGTRRVLETPCYVCSSHYTDYYRHLVAAAWDVYSLFKDKSRLFLWNPVHRKNGFLEEVAARQTVITNSALIETCDLLYWDPALNRPKIGAQTRNRLGNIRRLISFIRQVELTYDLYAMSVEEILSLLPAEFDSWKIPSS